MEQVKIKQKKRKVKLKSDEPGEHSKIAEDIVENAKCYSENVMHNVTPNIDNAIEVHDSIDTQNENFSSLINPVEIAEEITSENVAGVSQEFKMHSPTLKEIQKVKSEPSAPTFKELSEMINQLDLTDDIKEKTIDKTKILNPFTFEEIENIFGMKEMVTARERAVEFETYNLQVPSPVHPLYEALTQYQRARSQMLMNQKDIDVLISECITKQKNVWLVRNRVASGSGKCEDGVHVSKSYKYTEALMQKSLLSDLQKELKSLKEKATEIHSLHSHSEYLLKLQVDDLLWTAIKTGKELMKDALNILFFVIRSSGWGFDKHLRQQLRSWCCLLAEYFLKHERSFDNVLFILHHILRVPQGIRWARHLIQCDINELGDVYKAFCLLEAILILSQKPNFEIKSNLNKKSVEIDDSELIVAAEATDDSLWLVVDSEGEGADIETIGTQKKIILKETDIIGLIRQIPFDKIFKELLIIKENSNGTIFCGGNLSGGSIIKIFSTIRVFLHIVRTALLFYKNYSELSTELCRLALHSFMYCFDLWEMASSQCEANLYERLSVEYNNLLLASILTLESAGSREISSMFISELPFSLCRDDIIRNIYNKLCDNLIVSDSIWCYYTLATFANMTTVRSEEEFCHSAIKKLFEIGYCSDFIDLGCGEWARTLCGVALHSSIDFIEPVLNDIPPNTNENWLNALPLSVWRPQTSDLLKVLHKWKLEKINLLPQLLKSLDWSPIGGLDLQTQRNVAIFLAKLAEHDVQLKMQPPEWIWQCLLLLKLHHIDWKLDLSTAPIPESFIGVDISGKCYVTNVMLMLTTTLGHQIPSILQQSGPLLIKLANLGRFTEVIHILYYLVPCLAESPDSIKQNKIFKELLSLIFKDEKSWQKMATRLVNRDLYGPHVNSLLETIKSHLSDFEKFSMSSPRPIMSVWIHWITSLDNWQSDWICIHLLDSVLGSCFFQRDAMTEASNIFQSFIQLPTSPKSPTSSTLSSWFWNNSTSFKGLVQCSMEAPFFWHIALWIEHMTFERGTGIWQKLIEKLSLHKEGTKVNIDKAFKSVGGTDNSSMLVIYRSIQYAMNTPLSHPIFTLIWQLFFYLYLDTTFIFNKSFNPIPVGPLFFQGIINSKILSKAKARLLEAKQYHETKASSVKEEEFDPKELELRKAYHTYQAELMKTFHLWLDDNFFDDYDKIFTYPHADKLNLLMRGQNDIWMGTIDLHQFGNLKPTVKIFNAKHDVPKYKLPYSRSKTVDLPPDERVLQRLKTYESPVKEPAFKYNDTCLTPIIDPKIIGDVNKIHKTIKSNLNDLTTFSKKYCNMCLNLHSIDENLVKLINSLYRKKNFFINSNESCGALCKGSANIIITGEEYILNENVNSNIDSNRDNHQIVLNKALEPYQKVSIHTAIISKFSQMICSGAIPLKNDDGARIFYMVLEYMQEENIQFPPINNIFNNVASQLGEKFIGTSGVHCSNLISQMKYVGNEALICSLLRPLDLPTDEMLAMYKIVNSAITDLHVAFSCLSKFRISNWLRDARPTVNERSIIITHICDALASRGCTPPPEMIMLQELMCVHFGHVLAWEFPVHLNQVLSYFQALSLEKKLPPDCWEHCFGVIEKYPHMVSHQQACGNMEMFGHNWWSKRGAWGLHGLYDQYAMYTHAMARLGALLTSTILGTAMVQQPLLMTHQISSVVFNSMCAFWNVWLVPRWDSTQPGMVSDFSRSPPLMPWGPEDSAAPETMLDAFVETLTYCMETLPGSLDDFLRLTWLWYSNNYPNPAIGSHVLTRVHKALSKLPWSASPTHWITYSELHTMSKICSLPLPSCHNFMQTCLGNRIWTNWIYEMPDTLQSNALCTLLPLIIKLRPEQNVFNDALYLPWGMIKMKNFEEILMWYMNTFNTTSEPFFSNDNFSLICAAGGLKLKSEVGIEWQSKRILLIKEWVNNNLSLIETKVDNASQKINMNKDISDSIADLLSKIETTVMNLLNSSDEDKAVECTNLLQAAIMMLNMDSLQDIAKKRWIDWISNTSKLCVESMIGCILSITNKILFAEIAEHTLSVYFNHSGEWSFILNKWKHNCFVPVNFLIDNNVFLTAFATYKSTDLIKYEGRSFELLDKHIITTLLKIEPVSAYENQLILWILYMASLVFDPFISKINRDMALNQVTTILEKWSEEPGLWQSLVKNVAPSPKFRILSKYAYCAMLFSFENIKVENSAFNVQDKSHRKFYTALESMLEQKQFLGIKHIIEEYLGYLKEKSKNSPSLLIRIAELCSKIYQDSYYLIKVSDLVNKT